MRVQYKFFIIFSESLSMQFQTHCDWYVVIIGAAGFYFSVNGMRCISLHGLVIYKWTHLVCWLGVVIFIREPVAFHVFLVVWILGCIKLCIFVWSFPCHCQSCNSVADPKILKKEEDNLSALSSFIANAHNEIYAFYTEKSGFLKKISANRGGPPPLLIRHYAIGYI